MSFLIRIKYFFVPRIVLFHGVRLNTGGCCSGALLTKTNVPGKLARKDLTLRHYFALTSVFLLFSSIKFHNPYLTKATGEGEIKIQEGIEVFCK